MYRKSNNDLLINYQDQHYLEKYKLSALKDALYRAISAHCWLHSRPQMERERTSLLERVTVRNLVQKSRTDNHGPANAACSVDPYQQPFYAVETLSLHDVYKKPHSRGGRLGGPQFDYLLNHEIEESLSNGRNAFGTDLDNVELPPIQDALKESTGKAVMGGAPIADVLNAISPEAGSNAQDSLFQIQAHKSLISNGAAGSTAVQDETEPSSKRRKMDTESIRTLPRPARKSGKKQQAHALLPPLLAPLYNPPVDAKVVPSMNADRMHALSGLDNLLGFGASLESRVTINAFESRMPPKNTGSDTLIKKRDKDADLQQSSSQPSLQADIQQAVEIPGPKNGKKYGKSKQSKRLIWTAEETQHLIDGVGKFGIGNWHKILNCKDYQFQEGRKSTDLKDRFRTCFPDEYRQNGAQGGKPFSIVQSDGKRRGRGSRAVVEIEKLGLATKDGKPFPKQDRRLRKGFSQEEDESLLQGFLRYPSQWKKIQSDPDLKLQHRTRTDLRDRFRNRYPQQFKEAKCIDKTKVAEETIKIANDPSSSQQSHESSNLESLASNLRAPAVSDDIPDMLSASLACTSLLNSQQYLAHEEPTRLRLLATGVQDTQDFDFHAGYEDEDEEDQSGVYLNNSIFDWADQNKLNNPLFHAPTTNSTKLVFNSVLDTTSATRADMTRLHFGKDGGSTVGENISLIKVHAPEGGGDITISPADQYNMNPLDAVQRLPALEGMIIGHPGPAAASVPLSKILNDK